MSTTSALEGRMDCRSVTGNGWTFRMDDADPAQAFVGFLAAMPAPVAGAFTYPQLERVARGVARGVLTGAR
jgi:hypothetical protein